MAPPKRPWFRFYTEALTDPKLRRLTPEERWLYVAVLGAARQSPLPGWLMLTEAVPFDFSDLAELAGVTEAKVVKGTDKMQGLGLIDYDQNISTWFVPSWDARQFESDKTAERVAKHRSSNGDVTPKRRRKADDVTPPETETENRDRYPTKDDDDLDVVGPEVSSSSGSDPHRLVWQQYAHLVAESQAAPIDKLDAFLTSVARKAKRERSRRLEEYLRACPTASPETLARWLYDDIDPVTIDRPEVDPDFTPADQLTVIEGGAA